MNKKLLITSLITIILLVVLFFVFIKDDEKEKKPVEKEPAKQKEIKTEEIKVEDIKTEEIKLDNFENEEEKEKAQIFMELNNNNFGEATYMKEYKKGYQLVLTKSGGMVYSEKDAGDKLVWVKKDGDQINIKNLTNTGRYIKVIEYKGTPYIKVGNETYVITFYYRYINGEIYNEEGEVYKVKSNNDIEKIYDIKDAFKEISIKDGKIVLKQKKYNDPLNQYPSYMKGYILQTVEFKKDSFEVIKEEKFEPQVIE